MLTLVAPLTRSIERHHGTDLRIVRGESGAVSVEAYRLPSGHAFVTAWLHRSPTPADEGVDTFVCPVLPGPCLCDVLTQKASQRYAEAWDRGGDAALFALVEQEFHRLVAEVR